MRLFLVIFAVEALAASWIEMNCMWIRPEDFLSKPLRLRGLKSVYWQIVAGSTSSKPLRLRGLKYFYPFTLPMTNPCRSPCGFVDWNKFAPGEIQGFFCISPAVLWVENKIQNIVKKSLFCERMLIKG